MNNLVAEKTALAIVITFEHRELFNSLQLEDFTSSTYQKVFSLLSDECLSFIEVCHAATKAGIRNVEISTICEAVPIEGSFTWRRVLGMLRECRAKREAERFLKQEHDPKDLPNLLIEQGLRMSDLLIPEGELASDVIEQIKNPPPLVATGFRDADKMLGGGIPQTSLFIVAAESGFGKSYMAAALAANALKAGKSVHFTSLEMTAREVHIRVLKAYHQKSGSDVCRDIDKLWEYGDRLVTQCRKAKLHDVLSDMHRNAHADLFIVDYLGLVKDPSEKNNVIELGNISRAMKQFALFHKKPVVALHQINREAVKQGRRPTKSDLRGSGQIEENADQVTFLWSEEIGDEVTWIFDKNRHGPNFEILVALDRKIGFSESHFPQ